ncbi:hypothetical protein SAMN04487891_11058 [Flagellimonas taeanensis]|uniref:Uncharacterized protein n=1 Tax=Flagellimonas taeanensis TaxID=1005926 RepID=A0A1M7B819_9FLAO|nr:hypothetical protein SAMN04487891_11058 [Allomuricauda taeanensis]SHL51168.1 hypothetical protein SAMN05216293_3617 [Allomuricauda taeanensis]
MGNLEMDGFCWMCAAVWIGGILLVTLIIYLIVKLLRKNRKN